MGEIYDKLKKIQEQRNEAGPAATVRQQSEARAEVKPEPRAEPRVDSRPEVDPRVYAYVPEKPRKSNTGMGLSPVLFTIAIIIVVAAICVLMLGTANNYILEKRNLLTQLNSVQKITDDNAKSVVFFTQEIGNLQTNLKTINRKIDDANEKFSRVELQGVKYATDIKLVQQENSDLNKKISDLEGKLSKAFEEIEALKVKPKK